MDSAVAVEMSAVGGENLPEERASCSSSSLHPVESEQSIPATSETSAMSSNSYSGPLNASSLKATRHKAKYTIKRLEKKLEVLSRHIKSFAEEELSLDDMMKGTSAYMKEDLLKRKFVATWNELCDVLSLSPEIEIIHDDGASFSDTPYPEINRRVQRLLKKDEFPDHFDICELIDRCNTKHNLAIGADEKAQLSRKVFKKVGAILKSRRQIDFKQHFGSHLTDVVKDSEDPALKDEGLLFALKSSVKDGQAKLEELCEGFVSKQEQDTEAGKSPDGDSCNSDNEEEEEEKPEEIVLDVLNEPEGGDLEAPQTKRIKLTSSEEGPPPLIPDTSEPHEEDITHTNKDESEVADSSKSSNDSFVDVESNGQALSLSKEPIPSSFSPAPVICVSDNDDNDSDVVIVSD